MSEGSAELQERSELLREAEEALARLTPDERLGLLWHAFEAMDVDRPAAEAHVEAHSWDAGRSWWLERSEVVADVVGPTSLQNPGQPSEQGTSRRLKVYLWSSDRSWAPLPITPAAEPVRPRSPFVLPRSNRVPVGAGGDTVSGSIGRPADAQAQGRPALPDPPSSTPDDVGYASIPLDTPELVAKRDAILAKLERKAQALRERRQNDASASEETT